MVVLEGGAVSYERGTPVERVTTQVKVLAPVKREECCVFAAKSFKSRGDRPPQGLQEVSRLRGSRRNENFGQRLIARTKVGSSTLYKKIGF